MFYKQLNATYLSNECCDVVTTMYDFPLLSDHEYPTRVAHTLLTKVLADFASSVPQNLWSTGSEDTITYNQLPVYLSKYQVPKEIDAMTRIQEELDETKIILVSFLREICLIKLFKSSHRQIYKGMKFFL